MQGVEQSGLSYIADGNTNATGAGKQPGSSSEG